jgi:hypothetical protein
MGTNRFETSGRSMRWYEWLAGLLLLSLAFGVRAGAIYRCASAGGVVAFQGQPCAMTSVQTMVDIAPAPAYVPPPQYVVGLRTQRESTRNVRIARPLRRQAMSWECRSSDGRVFYRHNGCPRSIAASGSAGGRRSRSASSVSVSGHPVPREEACAQMHRAGAIGRGGHEFDEHVSTYDRNLGHDPCT